MLSYSTELSARVAELKKLLLSEVSDLLQDDGRLWKRPIISMLKEFREAHLEAVVFGGTLRSLLVSRIYSGRPGRPRDIDVVVAGGSLNVLEDQFRPLVARRNRFGGLRLRHEGWEFDVWPVEDTWALRQDGLGGAGFSALPSSTTFNIESVAVDVWPRRRHGREIFSGDDQFFRGVLARTVELNRQDNPYPLLTVVRALILAAELEFCIGPRLAVYIDSFGKDVDADDLEAAQRSHYGHVRLQGHTLQALIGHVRRAGGGEPVRIPPLGQLPLFERSHPETRLRVHLLTTRDGSAVHRQQSGGSTNQ
jgi:hypothetical protein